MDEIVCVYHRDEWCLVVITPGPFLGRKVRADRSFRTPRAKYRGIVKHRGHANNTSSCDLVGGLSALTRCAEPATQAEIDLAIANIRSVV